MNKKYYVITLIAVISLNIVLHAADDNVQLPEQLMICVAGLKKANDNLHISITLSDTDSFSGITFGNLFKTNALKHRIPWVIYAVWRRESPYMLHFSGQSISEAKQMFEANTHYSLECYDTLSLLDSQNIRISSDDLASGQATNSILFSSITQKLKECSADLSNHRTDLSLGTGLVYYNADAKPTSISPYNVFELSISTYLSPAISDLSCTLAIAQKGDYSQIVPILWALLQHNDGNEVDEVQNMRYKYNFWLKTFKSLPLATQQILIADAQERFGITLDLATE